MSMLSALLGGLGLGSMYGLMALGFYVTYAVSGTVNFAQGSSMMLGAVLTFTFAQTLGWPVALAVLLALLLCALYGLVVEFMAVRPFASRGSNAWLIATGAHGIGLDNAVLFPFGEEPRSRAGHRPRHPRGRLLEPVRAPWPQLAEALPDLVEARTVALDAAATAPGSDIVCTFTNTLQQTDIQVVKTASPDPVVTGGVVSYQIVVSNNGPQAVTDVLLTDVAGAGQDCTTPSTTATCLAAGGASWPSPTVPVGSLLGAGVTIPTLPVGGAVTFGLQCRVTASGL